MNNKELNKLYNKKFIYNITNNYKEYNNIDENFFKFDLDIDLYLKNLNVKLYNYQIDTLKKMIFKELSYRILIQKNLDKYKIDSNIGILSEKVGSGKTLIVLALILSNKNFEKYSSNLHYKNIIYTNYLNLSKNILNIIINYLDKDNPCEAFLCHPNDKEKFQNLT